MAARTITGTIYHPGTNTAWPSAAVIVALLAPFTAGATTYPAEKHTATTDSGGAFSLAVAVPSSGTAAYKITLPDGTSTTVNLASGASVDLATLLSIPGSAVAESAITTAIAAEAALRAAADTSEATTRASADTTLTTSVTAATYGFTRTTANNAGASDATTQLQADLATALAAGHKRLYLPAGTYNVSATTGNILNLTSDGAELFGDGIGKTIINFTGAGTLSGDVSIIACNARSNRVHDLSITGGASATFGTRQIVGVQTGLASFDAVIERVECYSLTGGAAGLSTGGGFGTNMAWDTDEFSTTLSAAISSTGSQTATPVSMKGINVGRLILVGSEYVRVTAVTASTFTANFTATKASGAAVHVRSFGQQRATFIDCIVRDSWQLTGFGVPSNNNSFIRCKVLRVGDSSLRHGWYIQGGSNYFENCYAEGVSGWSYHGWKKGPTQESGGDRFVGCISINPVNAHMIISGIPSNGTNPSIPNGMNLTRYTQVTGCTFRSEGTLVAGYAAQFDHPVVFDGNVIENYGITEGTGGSVVSNNKFLFTAFDSATAGAPSVSVAAGSRVIGNVIDGGAATFAGVNTAIAASGANVVISGNWVRLLGTFCKCISASANVTITDNYLEADTGYVIDIGSGASVVLIRGNTLVSGGTVISPSMGSKTGIIAGNRIVTGSWRADSAPIGLLVEKNIGSVNANGRTASTLLGGEGRLLVASYDTTNGNGTNGLLLKWSGGKLVKCTTSDTLFAAVAYAEALNTNELMLYAYESGAAVLIATDGAWTIGNIGIVSTSTAGKIHDSGSTAPPASGSYVLFLDTGASAGNARCMLVKTL